MVGKNPAEAAAEVSQADNSVGIPIRVSRFGNVWLYGRWYGIPKVGRGVGIKWFVDGSEDGNYQDRGV
jgi:hypothetical protein